MTQGNHPDHPPTPGGYTGNPVYRMPVINTRAIGEWLEILRQTYGPNPIYDRQSCVAGLNYHLLPLGIRVSEDKR